MTRNDNAARYRISSSYILIFIICISFIIIAFILDTPKQIMQDYLIINTSRSVLVTDYIALSGVSAALFNSGILTLLNLILLIVFKCPATGRIIAALFVTLGFSLFGKNMVNSIPIMLGVWIYGKFFKVEIKVLMALIMFSTTISPIVSEIAFLGDTTSAFKLSIAFAVGLFLGFIFPIVTEGIKKMHNNYCLYSGGIAGGFIATFCIGFFNFLKIEVKPEYYWDTSNSFFMTIIAYSVALIMIVYGLIVDKPGNALKKLKEMLKENDPADFDFFAKYGKTSYINIGIMCILSTTIMLMLKIPINGPILGGIFTSAGFGAAGKHLRNTIPILFGSIAVSFAAFNLIDSAASVNSLAILFSTGLAPMCSKYGWKWGIVIGIFHVSIAVFVGNLNGGLNLYNNGFAGSFVTITLMPIIISLRKLSGVKK